MPESTARERWETALIDHFTREYAANPLPDMRQLPQPDIFQGQITYDTLKPWLGQYGPQFVLERKILADSFGVDGDPNVIILSNLPGLIACKVVLRKRLPHVFYLPRESFASFLAQHPDATQRWHVVYSCYFSDELPREVLSLAKKKYKVRKSEQYWIHYEVSTLAPRFERGCIHLWKWNGQEPTLLEEAFYTWVR